MSSSFPLSTEQRSMMYMDRLLGPGILHNITATLDLPTGTTRALVVQALRRLSDWHQGLLAIVDGPNGGTQRIGRREIEVLDPPAEVLGDSEVQLARLRHLRLNRNNEPRVRAEFSESGTGNPQLALALDHLTADGTSRTVVMRDLAALLDPSGARLVRPSPIPQPFADYCREQERTMIAEGTRRRELERWKRALDGVAPLTGLTPKGSRNRPLEARVWQTCLSGREMYDTLHALVDSTRTTAFVVASTLYSLVLWRRTNAQSSALVTPVPTRSTTLTQNLVANMAVERPVPYRIEPAADFNTLAQSVGNNFLGSMRGSRVATPDLAEEIDEFRALFQSPDCEYLQLQVEVAGPDRELPPPGEQSNPWAPYQPPTDITCTVLRVITAPHGTLLTTFYGGPTGVGETVNALTRDFVRLARLVVRNPRTPVWQLTD
ncbi:condensation domain-containing protein [Streptomyces prunicolor]|uniref:condensation domain-containing protein n=1 Tax=Streptomyces prunicolor TaxID=67348 RepID=UPI003417C605